MPTLSAFADEISADPLEPGADPGAQVVRHQVPTGSNFYGCLLGRRGRRGSRRGFEKGVPGITWLPRIVAGRSSGVAVAAGYGPARVFSSLWRRADRVVPRRRTGAIS